MRTGSLGKLFVAVSTLAAVLISDACATEIFSQISLKDFIDEFSTNLPNSEARNHALVNSSTTKTTQSNTSMLREISKSIETKMDPNLMNISSKNMPRAEDFIPDLITIFKKYFPEFKGPSSSPHPCDDPGWKGIMSSLNLSDEEQKILQGKIKSIVKPNEECLSGDVLFERGIDVLHQFLRYRKFKYILADLENELKSAKKVMSDENYICFDELNVIQGEMLQNWIKVKVNKKETLDQSELLFLVTSLWFKLKKDLERLNYKDIPTDEDLDIVLLSFWERLSLANHSRMVFSEYFEKMMKSGSEDGKDHISFVDVLLRFGDARDSNPSVQILKSNLAKLINPQINDQQAEHSSEKKAEYNAALISEQNIELSTSAFESALSRFEIFHEVIKPDSSEFSLEFQYEYEMYKNLKELLQIVKESMNLRIEIDRKIDFPFKESFLEYYINSNIEVSNFPDHVDQEYQVIAWKQLESEMHDFKSNLQKIRTLYQNLNMTAHTSNMIKSLFTSPLSYHPIKFALDPIVESVNSLTSKLTQIVERNKLNEYKLKLDSAYGALIEQFSRFDQPETQKRMFSQITSLITNFCNNMDIRRLNSYDLVAVYSYASSVFSGISKHIEKWENILKYTIGIDNRLRDHHRKFLEISFPAHYEYIKHLVSQAEIIMNKELITANDMLLLESIHKIVMQHYSSIHRLSRTAKDLKTTIAQKLDLAEKILHERFTEPSRFSKFNAEMNRIRQGIKGKISLISLTMYHRAALRLLGIVNGLYP
jgi:hypothetical protein